MPTGLAGAAGGARCGLMRALLSDAAGTLRHLSEPAAVTYARIGRRFGVSRSEAAIQQGFLSVMRAEHDGLRYVGDGRVFWRAVVSHATGCADPDYFESVYAAFGASAWSMEPGALAVLEALRDGGRLVAVVSNWDTRLRPILAALGVLDRVDVAIISGEIGLEKPDPRIFHAACGALSVAPAQALHLGDSLRADVEGARGAGLSAWHFGRDLESIAQLPALLLR